MKTARLMFPLMVALTAGCATTLDNAAGPRAEKGAETPTVADATACVVAGSVHTLAPQALVRPGVELLSTMSGLALGFRKTTHDGVIMKLDPSSATATKSLLLHSADTIRRITPFARNAETLEGAIDGDCEANRVDNAFTLSAKDPFVVGTAGSDLVRASCASGNPEPLWHLSDGKVQDLHGIGLEDGGYAILFRQNGALWFGRLDAEKNPTSSLSKIAQRSQLRWPTIAESGDHLLVVWSEQVDGRDQWSLAGASIAPCGHPTPLNLDLPIESAEGDAIQPALAPVDANHFLLVWTEGTSSGHDVRAVTLEAQGHALGPALKVSFGAESGWGRPAVLADGRGAIVYFVPTDSGFALAATPIACPLSAAPAARVESARL